MTTPKPTKVPTEALRSARLEAALERAVTAGDTAEFTELLRRSSGLPGPRPNLDFARVVALALAGYRGKADVLVRTLLASNDEFEKIVAAITLGARSVAGLDPRGALTLLEELAEEPRHIVRDGVIEALRVRIRAVGEPAVEELASWTDGYLQASVVLGALADRDLLTTLPRAEPVIARLDEAFTLADESPRAAERSQGVRTLRQELPAQIAVIAARYPETLAWLEQAARAKRPETREVIDAALRALRRNVLSDADAKRIGDVFDASAPPRRDADRVVHGTRKRSKGRR